MASITHSISKPPITGLLSCLRYIPIVSAISCSTPQAPEPPPNFVIVLFDDLGWDDLGFHGNSIIETPNLDAFAAQSARVSDFYVNPVCAASRASLLTGRFFLRTGVSHVHGGKDFMAADETTIAQVLQQHGYATGMWGKWHNGTGERYDPWQRGFDEAFAARLYKHRNAEGLLNGQPVFTEKWADELIVDYTIDFIERHQQLKPFFAFVSLLSPHTPLVAPDTIAQKYMDKGLSENLSTLYAMVDYSDRELGRLFSAIDDMDLTENTVVIILSDNGPAVNRAELSDHDRQTRYVNQYRGHKGDIWENGVRSPLFVRWPGKIEAGDFRALADVTDLFPTLLNMAGIDHVPAKPLDGISMKSELLNQANDQHKLSEKRFIYNYSNKGWPPSLRPYDPDGTYDEYRPSDKSLMNPLTQVISVRAGRYKLLQYPGVDGDFSHPDSLVLIDMQSDPKETINLAYRHPNITSRLRDSLGTWYSRILMENTSYAPPVIYLNPHKETPVRATWVSDLSPGLLNTVTAVKYWSGGGPHAGSWSSGHATVNSSQELLPWVSYLIDAPHTGDYSIELQYSKPQGAFPVGMVQTPSGSITTKLVEEQSQQMGNIRLEKGQQTMKIVVLPDANEHTIRELTGMVIKRHK